MQHNLLQYFLEQHQGFADEVLRGAVTGHPRLAAEENPSVFAFGSTCPGPGFSQYPPEVHSPAGDSTAWPPRAQEGSGTRSADNPGPGA